MTPVQINWDEARKDLLQTIKSDPNIEIIRDDPDDMVIYDMDSDRELRYRLKPHDMASLDEILHIGLDCKFDDAMRFQILQKLLLLRPYVLLNLQGIIVVKTLADLTRIVSDLNISPDNIPENILDADDDGNETLSQNLVGLHWHQESMVIINLDLIQTLSHELAESDSDYDSEFQHGFWVTLLHELRHNQCETMLYEIPWLNTGDGSESKVEQWAIDTYEQLFYTR